MGGIYRWKEAVKVALLGTIVADHFADANNTFQRAIPAYNVWDLTAEVNFCNGRFGVFAGINNLFDEDFYAEARDEGIVPALPAELLRRLRNLLLRAIPQAWEIRRLPLRHCISGVDLVRARR